MGDNEAQYSQRDKAGQDRARRMQDGRKPGNRAQYMRQQQQIQQRKQKKRMKRWIVVFATFTWAILLLNVAAVVSMHSRLERVNETFLFMIGQMSEQGLISERDLKDFQERRSAASNAAAGSKFPALAAGAQAASDDKAAAGGEDYISLCGLEHVDKPRERTMKQVLERLESLAEDDGRIAQILEDSYKYPDKLLEALANNPEMTDFVMGYPDSDGSVSGTLTQSERKQDFPLFLQWDPRWGYGEYGDGSNIGLAGCGPACLSMALYYLTGDAGLTPDVIAEYSMENGYYMSGTGTAWALMKDVPEQYGIAVSQPKAEEHAMKTALDSGSVIICSMGPGDFTAAGHFIVIYGYDKKGFLVNDPNCIARSRQSWSFDGLKKQIKNTWVLGGTV